MKALRASSFSSFHLTNTSTLLPRTQSNKPVSYFSLTQQPISFPSSFHTTTTAGKPILKLFTAISPTANSTTESTDPPAEETEIDDQEEKFDWFSEWYPIMPVCDLHKRAPHGKKVMGLDVVVWWDRNQSTWKVFDDSCPHRLAPLSEGRIDQWGRLQCVYHGWCFGGSGDCKFIPQAPRDGPPIHTSQKACVAVYPSTVQNGIVWFWPNTDPQYKDILVKKKPPYISELDDPSYAVSMLSRDIPYGYEVLIENLMDPAHVPYAHHGILRVPQPKADREGGRPLDILVQNRNKNGFASKQAASNYQFIPPCVYYGGTTIGVGSGNGSASSAKDTEGPSALRRINLVFICIPVSPGNSRLIFSSLRNFAVWIDRVVPRWMFHVNQNLVLDSDLYLLHVEERKIMDVGPRNWEKACFVPTKSDASVVAFRKWLKKYAGGQIDWGNKFSGALPPSPPREQLMDRYWSHVVNCRSCSAAYKGLGTLEVALQVLSIALVALVAASATKQRTISTFTSNSLLITAILCFAASRWLSHFLYKTFHFHDYNHAFR